MLEKIKSGDLDEQEIEQAKTQLRGNLLLSFENSSRRMRRIAEAEVYNLPQHSLDETMEMIKRVEKKDVLDVVEQMFTINNTSITILSP